MEVPPELLLVLRVDEFIHTLVHDVGLRRQQPETLNNLGFCKRGAFDLHFLFLWKETDRHPVAGTSPKRQVQVFVDERWAAKMVG